MPNYYIVLLLIGLLVTGTIWFANKILNFKTLNENKLLNDKTKLLKFNQFIASFFPILLTIFIVRSFIIEPFQIPSGSMIPTLLIGDFILVQKFSYGIKNPINNNTLISVGHPKRGDVIVFKYPKNSNLNFIKRVIGLPGDMIYYDKCTKNITVIPKYAEKNKHKLIFTTKHSSNIDQSFIKKFFNSSNQFIITELFNYKNQYPFHIRLSKETLHNSIYHVLFLKEILDNDNRYYKQMNQKIGHWIVPDNEYFVMGDNRDISLDSRYWGFVPEKNLIGKAIIIWMNLTYDKNKIFPRIKFNRVSNIY